MASVGDNTAAAGGTMQAVFYEDVGTGGTAYAAAPRPTSISVANPNRLSAAGPKLCGFISPAPQQWEINFLAQVGVTVSGIFGDGLCTPLKS